MHALQTEVVLRHAGAELARLALAPGEYVIGREPGVEIPVETPLLSRRHARLTIRADHLLLEDLGSANGTFVAEQPIAEPTRLLPNQSIRLGPDITLEVRPAPAPSEPEVTLVPGRDAVRRALPAEVLATQRYAIGAQVARGGMGAILAAQQRALKRPVAMKVMLESTDAGDALRFVEEAQVTGQLEHPNIVPVHELGVDEQDQLFYTMKMVRGVTLKKILELLAAGAEATVKKYPLPALLTIFQKACDAIAFAHSRGVIHRDLKPENIMLGDFGEVLVMDWGLAKIVGGRRSVGAASDGSVGADGAAPSSVVTARTGAGDFGSTLAGTIMGTPAYMSPEQARGEIDQLDACSDIYALGTILFELLHLRPVVTGPSAMAIVDKVARGTVEWAGPPTKDRPVPASLLAVCRKALALEPAARYASVEDLQRDLAAYQGGFATSAENAGLARQIFLAVMRHKVTTAAALITLLLGIGFGTKAILEGRRAEREAGRANRALTELKASAPALLQLAESEADTQHFTEALRDLEAALALDPALAVARWQRAWVLLGQERWSAAATALRLARENDPAENGGTKRHDVSPGSSSAVDAILPAVEKLAAAPDPENWKSEAFSEVFAYLRSVEAIGPMLAFSAKLKLGAEERRKIVEQRLLTTLGQGNYYLVVAEDGAISVNIDGTPLRSLEPLHGLPINNLTAVSSGIFDLEPLRGMPLASLILIRTKVVDLSPIRGMHLSHLDLESSKVADLTPIAGMPIRQLVFQATRVTSVEALRGMPLVLLNARNNRIVDFSPLRGAPLENLDIGATGVVDLAFVAGMPLRALNLRSARAITNLTPLRGLPLEIFDMESTGIEDLSALRDAPLKELFLRDCKKITDYAPVLTLARLERLSLDVLPPELLPLRTSTTLQSIDADAFLNEGHTGPRPVADFWRAYDAQQAAEKK